MLPRILLLDDDVHLLESLSTALRPFAQVLSLSGVAQLPRLLCEVDLVITDFRLGVGGTPEVQDGNAVVRLIRHLRPDLPVVLMTAFATKEVAIEAANLHVFAILEKPFEVSKLTAVLRRALQDKVPRAPEGVPDPIELCAETLSVRVADCLTRLTDIEFRILVMLKRSAGKRLGREKMVREIWGDSRISDNALDTHLGNLKKKVPVLREKIQTVRGYGYIYL